MKVLINEFLDEKADENFKTIKRLCLVPWIIFALATLTYFTQVLADDFEEKSIAEGGVFKHILSALVLLGAAY